jgi:DNA-binding MarR family transcriptional regulator
MKNKDDKINEVFSRTHKIFYLRSLLEEKPICFAEGVKLTPKEVHTIETIGIHKSINIKEVGDYFGVTKSAASQMVKKLTQKGFVKKVNPPDNNKELQLTLTELGKRAFCVHEKFHAVHVNDMLEKLNKFSDEEIAATAKVLKVIEDTVRKRLAEL